MPGVPPSDYCSIKCLFSYLPLETAPGELGDLMRVCRELDHLLPPVYEGC